MPTISRDYDILAYPLGNSQPIDGVRNSAISEGVRVSLSERELLVVFQSIRGSGITSGLAAQVFDVHRSTAIDYLNKLVERGVLTKKIKEHTERKYRPTHIYFLAENIDRNSVYQAMSNRRKERERARVASQQSELKPPESNAEAKYDTKIESKIISNNDSPIPELKTEKPEILVEESMSAKTVSLDHLWAAVYEMIEVLNNKIGIQNKRITELENILTSREVSITTDSDPQELLNKLRSQLDEA